MAFENKLVEKVFEGVLHGTPVRLRTDLINRASLDQAISKIPLSLSPNQIRAIQIAWENEISYIQGPPGTGKSHTIRAIMLSALLLGKKVLLVSQKKAAIDVVCDEINKMLGQHSVIYIGNDAESRRSLKAFLQDRLQGAHMKETGRLPRITTTIHTIQENLQRNRTKLDQLVQLESRFYDENESFVKIRKTLQEKYEQTPVLQTISEVFKARAESNLKRLRDYEDQETHTRIGKLFFARSRKVYKDYLSAKHELANTFGSTYFQDLLNVDAAFTTAHAVGEELENRQRTSDSLSLRKNIEQDEKLLHAELLEFLKISRDQKLNYALNTIVDDIDPVRESVESFAALLHWVSPRKIVDGMQNIDYRRLSDALPLWAGEIKDLGNYLPFTSEVFDMVIVDEASQVNIAEIIPALYRGSRFCVVGDKQQLGLNAAGLFRLNKTFEELSWNQSLGKSVPFGQASQAGLLVSNSSILDFITAGTGFNVPQVMLDEHYRSMPPLAQFTSQQFYQGKLRVMTETPANVKTVCFKAIKVEGQRHPKKKVVPAEVDCLIEQLSQIIYHGAYKLDPLLSRFEFDPNNERGGRPTIGVVSFLTNQRSYIREVIEERFQDSIKRFDLRVGTPEEFQGNERDIIFITLGLDGSSSWGKGHYENPNRFNVATSRARKFTYLIYAGIPTTADLLRKYANHFQIKIHPEDFIEVRTGTETVLSSFPRWRFRDNGLQSEFEREVFQWLRSFADIENPEFEIYNQVPSCNKFIDFVIYNRSNEKSVAIEVDGKQHFGPDNQLDADDIERERVLKRAGWKILRLPYYDWYQDGWLCRSDNKIFVTKWRSFCSELTRHLV